MASASALQGIDLVGVLLRLLPERDPHGGLYEAADLIASHLHESLIGPPLMAQFELMVLAELGFGLDLTACAATGTTEDLVHVSPKSGRAVSRSAGEPYRDRLLRLPGFLIGSGDAAAIAGRHCQAGFRLTGFFLEREVFAPRGLLMPDTRRAYVEAVACGSLSSRTPAAVPSARRHSPRREQPAASGNWTRPLSSWAATALVSGKRQEAGRSANSAEDERESQEGNQS